MAKLFDKLLLEDTEEVMKIKSIYKKEEDYADILGPAEHAIAMHYLENKKLKDKEVARAVDNIRNNYSREADYFKEPLEKDILLALTKALRKRRIMRHELWLVLSYILWSIDNRKWLNSPRAYVDWLLQFFGIATRDEIYNITENVEVSEEDEVLSREDSEQFSKK